MAPSSSKMLQTTKKMDRTGNQKRGQNGKKTSPNNSIPAPLDTVVCSLVVQTRFSVMDPRIQTAKKKKIYIYIGILVVISFGHSVSHLSSVINPPSESLRHTLCILGLSPAPTISYIYTILYFTILYYTVLYYTTPLHYTTLHYTILYYTKYIYIYIIYIIYIYKYILWDLIRRRILNVWTWSRNAGMPLLRRQDWSNLWPLRLIPRMLQLGPLGLSLEARCRHSHRCLLNGAQRKGVVTWRWAHPIERP